MEETKLLLDRGGKIHEGGKVCRRSRHITAQLDWHSASLT